MRKRLYDDRDTIYLKSVFPLECIWKNIPAELRYCDKYDKNNLSLRNVDKK